MARIISSRQILSLIEDHELSAEGILWSYNAMDGCLTHEIEDKLDDIGMDLGVEEIIQFNMAQWPPAFSMMQTGFNIDKSELNRLRFWLEKRMDKMRWLCDEYGKAMWYKPLNPFSPVQLQSFFYDLMGIKPIYKGRGHTRKLTCDQDALEKILDENFYARPVVRAILAAKHIQGKLKVLKSKIDKDGRMRVSFNPAYAETGRWSSSKNWHGGGTNAQNITEDVRSMIAARPGHRLAYLDLEQAESRAVAYLSQDEAYIEACESIDLHTTVCRMIWPLLKWTGDIKKDRPMASKEMFDHIHSYRFTAKVCGHATNYYASPFAIHKQAKIAVSSAQEFQDSYFGRFTSIQSWHEEVATELQLTGVLTNPLGRRRQFFGRRSDDSTLREAIAHLPQSTIADLINMALLRVWRELQLREQLIELWAQVHDALLFEYPEEQEDEIIPRAIKLMTIPLEIKGRIMIVPVEAKVGYDWKNMAEYGSEKAAGLTRRSADILDRLI